MKKQIVFLLLYLSIYCNGISQYIDTSLHKADLIIFSFDRPLQLYALLESIDRYMTGISSLSVVYRVSNNRYEVAFKQVQSYFPSIRFLQQKDTTDFKALTLCALKESPSAYVMFAVDDNIVKDYVDVGECIEFLEKTDVYAFYLKLGLHLDYCYTENCAQKVPPYLVIDNNICSWKFEEGEKDWQYPNTVDMTLYRKEDLLRLFELFEYKNPNFLEAYWAAWWAQHKYLATDGLFYKNSKIINIPLNRVQTDILNRDMNFYTPEELVQKFEEGLKIDINPLYHFNNKAVHTEYEPTFIARK